MKATAFLCLLAGAAVFAASSRTAEAQAGPSAAAPAPTVRQWRQHPTGKYRLQLALPDRMMDADLTITDSAGSSTAIFWPVGDNDGHALTVTVKDTTLVLSASTPRGPFEMLLQRQGDQISGHYSMGIQEAGEVKGQVKEEAKTP